jgi:hypothetical protein
MLSIVSRLKKWRPSRCVERQLKNRNPFYCLKWRLPDLDVESSLDSSEVKCDQPIYRMCIAGLRIMGRALIDFGLVWRDTRALYLC